jgi:threonine aldolase
MCSRLIPEHKPIVIDLRSDTVTRPTPGMLDAMHQARTGDDVYGEDPTVNQLQQLAMTMTGKAAALYVTSGTQGNLLALLSHCQRGDEYIAGQQAHTYKYEGGGGAVLGGIQPQPLPFNLRGELDLEEVRQAIKPDDFHFARTRLVCLENTQAGKVLALDYLQQYSNLMAEQGLQRHLDGARLFNAAVKLGVDAKTICQHFDSVSICLSKGLGCPVGSLLVGDVALIARARRWRKMLGGGMRQAGVIAASGIYALQHQVQRLQTDHDHAALLGQAITGLQYLRLAEPVVTNMVILDSSSVAMPRLMSFLAARQIRITGPRLVIHLDISSADIQLVIAALQEFDALPADLPASHRRLSGS